MLNPFPIQWLALFAYFLLRFFVGTILIYLGLSHYKHRHTLKDVLVLSWYPHGKMVTWFFLAGEIIVGTLLILGAHTQYVAIAIMLMSLKMLVIRNWFNHPAIPQKLFYLLLFAAALSLFITGAGSLAFDLPI